jgi:hypothetical protein
VGIKMIVEILDHWQDWGLTAGERDDLIVVAEQARDETRETRSPVHAPYILKRAGKSAASWRNALGKLMKKKVLEHAVENGRKITGHEGQAARYRIPQLCPNGKHDGYQGQCKRVTSEMTHSPSEGHPTDDALGQEGHLTDARGSSEKCAEGHLRDDPYPSSIPQPPSSLSLPIRLVRAAAVVAEDEEERFINWLKSEHKPRLNSWWRTVAENGDFPDLVADWRNSQTTATAATAPSLPPWCGTCNEGDPTAERNPRFRTLNGLPSGPKCHCHPDYREDTAA